MTRNWLIVILIVSLVANAFLIGLIVGKPPLSTPCARPAFPGLPPVLKGRSVREFRDSFFQAKRPMHDQLRNLRHELAMEMASDSTDRARVDSLVNEINDMQRDLQLSIIDYIDSLKSFAPMDDQRQLRHWILESFGENRHMRHQRPGRNYPENPPTPQ